MAARALLHTSDSRRFPRSTCRTGCGPRPLAPPDWLHAFTLRAITQQNYSTTLAALTISARPQHPDAAAAHTAAATAKEPV